MDLAETTHPLELAAIEEVISKFLLHLDAISCIQESKLSHPVYFEFTGCKMGNVIPSDQPVLVKASGSNKCKLMSSKTSMEDSSVSKESFYGNCHNKNSI